MRKTLLVPILLLLLSPRPASAWGFEAHKYITDRAIQLLPPEIRPFFEASRTQIVEHAIDPDLWRNVGFDVESTRHFTDMDAYGPYPFTALPHDYNDAVKKFGAEMVDKNGTLPWRTEEIYRKLVEAFKQASGYSRDNIKLFSSVIAHYTADAHVPFHAALNHDGQLTGQWGLHSRFESELFDRSRSTLAVTPRPLVTVQSPREFIFQTLNASFTFVQPILDADKAAVAGKEVYDDDYFARFSVKARPILEKRVADSITDVASMITAAWIEAGRPAVPVTAPKTDRKVRRQ